MRPEFVSPEFVDSSEPDEIQDRMMGNLPADISDMPGDFPFDFTMPTAIEISQLVQFNLVRGLMIAFPEFAWGDWLDLHGGQVHVTRHEANHATGYLVVTGEAGTVVEAGAVFCVPATDTQEAIEFSADERTVLNEGEETTIAITAVEPGSSSNVTAGTIMIMLKPIKGIIAINNPNAITGGTDEEDDESYYDRIHAEYEGAESYVGNDSDYIRWAKEVPGIGECIVDSAWDGPGTVRLILVDSNGRPANEQLQNAVYDHIVSPGDRSKRLLPAGDATLTVTAAKTKAITYECTGIMLETGTTIDSAKEEFAGLLNDIYIEAKGEGVLRYNDVRPVLSKVTCIADYEDFRINNGYKNIVLNSDEYADTADIIFTEKV